MISIIVPVKKKTPELISNLKKYKHEDTEIIVVEGTKGRGQPIAKGIQNSSGKIMLVLHADTDLPSTWKEDIETLLEDEQYVGGGFSITFDNTNIGLKILVFLSNILFDVKKELWGDRAMFFRKKSIIDEIEQINVSIMEDIRLSEVLRKKGKLKILKSKLETSSDHFKKGFFKQTFKIIKCRSMYAFGFDLNKIYKIYYNK